MNPPPDIRRNIGIFAHIDAGKTTLTERMLFFAGVTDTLGEVDEGTTVTDWMRQEQERGITITAAAVTCHWRDHAVTIVDTPGHIDFTAEVERCLRVLDGGIAIFSGVDGVQPQSETVWRQAEHHGLPRLVFINKLDRPGADFGSVCDQIRQHLGARLLAFQLPLFMGERFAGVVDLLSGTALTYPEAEDGLHPVELPVPPAMRERVAQARAELFDAILDTDELIDRYLREGELPRPLVLAAARRAVMRRAFYPVFCGAARRNIGVQPVLDAVVDLLPSPSDIGSIVGFGVNRPDDLEERPAIPTAAAAGLVFKIAHDPVLGTLNYLRLYSGTIRQGTELLNPRLGRLLVAPRIVRMQANDAEDLEVAVAGDIVAIVGELHLGTGDTLCSPGSPLLLDAIAFPSPVIFQSLVPVTDQDHARLGEKLALLIEEDPTLSVSSDSETGETLIGGMGELHLEIALDRLRHDHGLSVVAGRPSVALRRTIVAPIQRDFQLAELNTGVSGTCSVHLAPGVAGEGVVVAVTTSTQGVAPELLLQLKAELQRALTTETMNGLAFSDIDVQVSLNLADGNAVDGRQLRSAIRAAVDSTVSRSTHLTLEPIMLLEILTPSDYTGPVLGDVQARGGEVMGLSNRGLQQHLRCEVPLSRMFGYASALRSLTRGRASCSMTFSHFGGVMSPTPA